MKRNTLIVFEDGKPELERIARSAAERLDPETHEVRLRAASSVTIPEMLAAEIYLLGTDAPNSDAYEEMARFLAGVNLAGRRAAFFGSSGAAVAWLRGICSDSEVAFFGTDFVQPKPDQSSIAAWIRALD